MASSNESVSRTSPELHEGWLPAVLRTLVYAVAAAVFAWPLTVGSAIAASGACAAVGSLVGLRLAKTRLRLPVIVGVGVLGIGAAVGLRHLVVGTTLVAPSLGPAATFRTGEAVFFGALMLACASVVRALAVRKRALAVFEVGFVAVAFGQLLVAHRYGAFHRPFELADPILARGDDPTHFLLAAGGIAAGLVMLLLLGERSVLRATLHMAVVAAVLLLVFVATTKLGPPAPPPSGGGLGLRGEEKKADKKPSKGRSGRGRGQRDNEQLEFRDDYDSASDPVPVGVVLFHDDYSPPSGVYYFRQGAFSQYNGKRLVAATRGDVDQDIASGFSSDTLKPRDVPSVRSERVTLDTTVALMAEHARPFGLEAPLAFRPASNPDTGRFKRVYRVTSASLSADPASLFGLPGGSSKWTFEQRAHYTAAPSDPRYRELASSITSELLPAELSSDTLAKAAAITQWLGEKGTYSLRSRHAQAEDPTADFLFGDKTGYCVHFAHAAVYLMRSLGVPSRVATGYAIEESARQGGSALMVTGQSSHAWPEIYLDGTGWVVMDVVPQRVLDPPPPPPDPDLQRLLGEMARGEAPLPQDGKTPPPSIATVAREAGVRVGQIGLGVLLALMAFLLVGKLWLRTAPLVAGPTHYARVVYRAELDRLSELSIRRRRGESREAFARRLQATAPSFGPLTAAHLASRFGGRVSPSRDAVIALVRTVRKELRAAVPWWKRALGALKTWSWLRIR